MDSIETFTRAVDQTGRIVAAVKPDQLGDPTPCADWDVRALLNHTIGGVYMFDDAAQGKELDVARFEQDVVALKPAVVVIIAGVNDVYQGRDAEHVRTELDAMYERASAAGIRVVAASIIPYNTAAAAQNARMHELNEWIASRSRRDSNMRFVDTRAAVAAPGRPDLLASSPDGLHPDAAGYRKMADAIAPAIASLL